MGHQNEDFRTRHYLHTVTKLGARLVVPIHWDNYCLPDARALDLIPASVSRTSDWLKEVIQWTHRDGVEFVMVPGGQSIHLFSMKP